MKVNWKLDIDKGYGQDELEYIAERIIHGDKHGAIETYDDKEYELHDRGNNEHLNEIGGLIEDFIKTKDLQPPKDVIIQHFIEWFTSDDEERNVMVQAMQYYLKEGIDKEIE